MVNQFAPQQPEKKVVVEITAREAHCLKKLRESAFGKIIVHKANGIIVRVESTESQMINETDGLDLSSDMLQ